MWDVYSSSFGGKPILIKQQKKQRARFRCDIADTVRRRLPNLPVQTDLSSVEWNSLKSSSEVGEQ